MSPIVVECASIAVFNGPPLKFPNKVSVAKPTLEKLQSCQSDLGQVHPISCWLNNPLLEAKCQGRNTECGHCTTTQLQYVQQWYGRVYQYGKLLWSYRPRSLASKMIVNCLNTTVVAHDSLPLSSCIKHCISTTVPAQSLDRLLIIWSSALIWLKI